MRSYAKRETGRYLRHNWQEARTPSKAMQSEGCGSLHARSSFFLFSPPPLSCPDNIANESWYFAATNLSRPALFTATTTTPPTNPPCSRECSTTVAAQGIVQLRLLSFVPFNYFLKDAVRFRLCLARRGRNRASRFFADPPRGFHFPTRLKCLEATY